MIIKKPKDVYSNIAKNYDEIYSNYKCKLEDSYIRTILNKNQSMLGSDNHKNNPLHYIEDQFKKEEAQ